MAVVSKTGNGGAVQVADSDDFDVFNTVAFIRNWTVEETADMLDVTDMSNGGARNFKTGLKTWTGTADLYIPFDETTGAEEITEGTDVDALTVGTEYKWKFYPDVSTGTFESYEAKGRISSISRSVAVDGMAEMSVSIQGVEALS